MARIGNDGLARLRPKHATAVGYSALLPMNAQTLP